MTAYVNTDLDLSASEDLTPLRAALEASGLFPLHVARREDGTWDARFETKEAFAQPERTISVMLDAVESLPEPLRDLWWSCSRREMNIGYDCDAAPWAFEQALSSGLLGRLAAIGAALRLTLYPVSSAAGSGGEDL